MNGPICGVAAKALFGQEVKGLYLGAWVRIHH
jgi:hypothetical protein